MSSRVVVGIVALTVVLAALAAVAAYFFEAVTPALALGAVAAILAALSFIVAGIALGRQQGVVSEQTSLAVLLDKSLVRMGRRIDEQEVKFAAARAVGAHRRADVPAADNDQVAAPMPRADTDAVEKPAPRTAMEVAGTKPEPVARERHKAKFLPPADATTVDYDGEGDSETAKVEFGRDFEIMLEPIVAIPSGNVAAYRVFAGFRQADGSHVPVTETPPGAWGETGAAFGEALAAGTAAIAERHFDVAGDARLYMPVTAALMEDERAVRALARRYADNPGMARSVTATLRASLVDKGGEAMAERVAILTGAGVPVAVHVDDAETDIASLAARLSATAVFADVESFPAGGGGDWLSPLMESTRALVVACGIRTESSVIAMMDLNVGYMCGPLFAEPKRLKAGEAVLAEAL